MLVMVAQNAQIDDGGITEGPVTVLDGGAADEHGVRERLLDGGGSHVKNEVLVAGLFELGNGVVQLGQIRRCRFMACARTSSPTRRSR